MVFFHFIEILHFFEIEQRKAGIHRNIQKFKLKEKPTWKIKQQFHRRKFENHCLNRFVSKHY